MLSKLKLKLKKFKLKFKKKGYTGYKGRGRGVSSSSRPVTTSRNPEMKQPSKKLIIFTYLSSFALFCMIAGILGLLIMFMAFSRDLPNPDTLLERDEELSTKLYDRNGQSISEVYGLKNRELININDVSEHVVHATLSVEDANFYQHQGFYLLGMLRAVKNTLTGQGLQGGSTLTQQVVKNAVLTQERTLSRKVKELSMSLQLENKYTKDEIMQMYLNETPYGGQNYGVLTAARAYFNKSPKDLTIAESAYIAGLPQSPSRYSYFGADPEAGLERKNYVLYLMNERGWVAKDGKRYYLSDEDYEAAKSEELAFSRGDIFFEAPHFVFYTRQVLTDLFGEEMVEQGGLQVTTTLDLDLQKKAEEIVKNEVESASGYNVGNGALVAVEPSTGGILAMVGSKDYFGVSEPEGCISGIAGDGGCVFDPNVNVATSLRQPGSSIKPITYATMLEQGYTAAFPFMDVTTKFEGSAPDKPYIPKNYDGLYRGPMSLRRSLANSLNIPAVKALKIVGIDAMLDTAERMGVTTLTDRQRYGLALTLGGGETKLVEMTGAFATFGNAGWHVEPFPIIEVKNAKGQTLYKHNPVGTKALSEEVAFLISDILSDDGARSSAFGAGSALNIPGHQVAVKTGTTNDLRDNYAMGYTKDISIGVWVGNSNNESMTNVASGITGATPIWNRMMIEFLSGKEKHEFTAPANVQKVTVDQLTGELPYEDFPTRAEWFIKGTEPTAPSRWYQKLKICEPDGKLANEACANADKTKDRSYIDVQAELPEWQPYVDAWIGENYNGKPEYFPPRMETALKFEDDGDVDDDSEPKVRIVNFDNGGRAPLEFRLEVEVSSPVDVEYVEVYLDGERVTKDESEPFGYNFDFDSKQTGGHTFRAKMKDENDNTADHEIKLDVVAY